MVLRTLVSADSKQVTEISTSAFPKPWAEKDFLYFIEHPASISSAIEINGVLCGYFLGLRVREEVDVISIGVRKSHQRQGIGKKLLEAICKDPKVKSVYLEVAVSNLAAIGLYQALQFQITGVRPRYYDGKEDALLMRWSAGSMP